MEESSDEMSFKLWWWKNLDRDPMKWEMIDIFVIVVDQT